MKRLVFAIILLSVLYSLSGCGSADGNQRSAFYSNFSLVAIVAQNEQYLIPGSRPLSGTEAGPAAPPYQKHEETILQIDTANVSKFIEAVKNDIKQAIIDSGARIEGQGGSFQDPVTGQADIDYISYRYNQGEANGIINLYGVRGEGTNYVIIVVLTESYGDQQWLT
jgi:hypothetical protein